MAEYDDTDRGAMFRNDKQGNEKRPDYRGSLDVCGVAYWISGWIKEAGPNSKKPGEKFMSLQVEAKEAKPAAPSHGVPDSAFGVDDAPF